MLPAPFKFYHFLDYLMILRHDYLGLFFMKKKIVIAGLVMLE